MNKNIIITLTIMLICIGLATAFSGLGTGTPEDPFQISTLSELNETRDNLTASYILTSDIDASDTYNWEGGWTPIGSYHGNSQLQYMYRGIFDGQNHTIFNLYSAQNGLFGCVGTDNIVYAFAGNIRLKDVNITGSGSVGGFAEAVSGNALVIRNIMVTGTVYASDHTGNVGLAFGFSTVYNGPPTISNIVAIGTSSAPAGQAGGLIGSGSAYLYDSYAIVNVTGYPAYSTGGFAGSVGSIGEIRRCYAAGIVNGGGSYTGGFAGWTTLPIYDSYYDTNISGMNDTGKGEPRTTDEMMQISTYSGWNFTDIWGLNEGSDYPDLRMNSRYSTGCTVDSDCDICRKCITGYCINQAPGEDLKDDCSPDYHACLTDYTRQGNDGTCNGLGRCDNSSQLTNVTIGNVCIDGADTAPTTVIHCNEQFDCLQHAIIATGYWTGYQGDGTTTCNDINWQTSGNNWNAIDGWWITTTEQATSCQQELYYVNPGNISNWFCSSFAACQNNGKARCLTIADSNHLNQTFTGNISDYDANCVYVRTGGGGGGGFPTTTTITPTPSAPTTFSLAGFLQSTGLKALWQSIKTWFLSIGVKI